MKTLFTLLASVALLCGCHTESNQGAANSTENSSEVLTNSKAGSGMVTNTQNSGAAILSNTNTVTPSGQ